MNLYSIDIKIVATAYIKAESEKEALEIAKENFDSNCSAELPKGEGNYVTVSDKLFDSPDLEDVSISPEISFCGPWDARGRMELVKENLPEDEEKDE